MIQFFVNKQKWFVLLLTLFPWVCLILFSSLVYVDIPFMDQWELVPLLEKYFQGNLSWNDLWGQFNEYRYPFFFLYWIPLAHLTNWNMGYEIAANIGLATMTFAILLFQFGKTMSGIGKSRINWMWPVLSSLFFSITQWENWLNGYQIIVFMNIFCVVAGIVLLSRPVFSPVRFLVSLFLGIVATYSVPIGMLYWPIGLVVFLMVTGQSNQRRVWIGVWLFASMVTVASYFYHYTKPAEHPSLLAGFLHPWHYFIYVLNFLGAPVIKNELAVIPGIVGLVLIIWCAWRLKIRLKSQAILLTPYIALGAYVLGSAMTIAVGRTGFGTKQALASRYVTISLEFWIPILVLLYLMQCKREAFLWSHQIKGQRHNIPKILIVGITVLVVLCSTYSILRAIQWQNDRLIPAREAILTGTVDDSLLMRIYPLPGLARERVAILKKYRLSLFRR